RRRAVARARPGGAMSEAIPSPLSSRPETAEGDAAPPDPTSGTHSGAHATRLLDLEQRAEQVLDIDERIALWVQLGASYDAEPLPEPLRHEIPVRMFRRTALDWPGGAPKWLERLLATPLSAAEIADAVLDALAQEGVEPEVARDLALAAGTALERRSANPATLYRALLERARALRDGSARSALAAEIAHRDLVAGKVDPWLNALREL